MESIEQMIQNAGFKPNQYGDAFDRGSFRVYLDDLELHVVSYTDSKNQIIQWNSAIDLNMGNEKAMRIVQAMTE